MKFTRKPTICIFLATALILFTGAVKPAQGADDPSMKALIEKQAALLKSQTDQLAKQKAELDSLSKKMQPMPPIAPQDNADAAIIPIPRAMKLTESKSPSARITSVAQKEVEPPTTKPAQSVRITAIVKQEIESQTKAAAESTKKQSETEGYVVGSDTAMTASWTNGFRLQSANKDFMFHLGGRLNFDSVWFDQPANLKGASPGGNLGVLNPGSTGVGTLDDGSFFRRVRLSMDGTIYETFEFNIETQFENLTTVTWLDLCGGMKDIPFLGTVRIGQMKVPQGLESYSTGRALDVLERSAVFETFWQLVGVGAFAGNTLFEEHMTWAAMVHKIETNAPNSGFEFGDGDYAFTGRITALPIFENEGRCLMHLGLSYQWRNAQLDRTTGLPGTPLAGVPLVNDAQRIVRFRSRVELRDGNTTQGNISRFVDTGNIVADDVSTSAAEFIWANGPVYVQAEATVAVVGDPAYPAAPAGTRRSDAMFWGAYAQVGWFLTGESRPYDRRFGRLAANLKPNENFFLVRDESGLLHHGIGAWELAYRYSFIDLNDNDSGIFGGLLGEHSFGLNWYWNANAKLQFNYLIADREVPLPAQSGTIHGFGIRAHYDF